MFQELRNKFIVTNMLIITSLIICCLGAIFISVSHYVNKDINARIDRSVQIMAEQIVHGSNHTPANDIPPSNDNPPPDSKPSRKPSDKPQNLDEADELFSSLDNPRTADRFGSEFSVYCDSDGNTLFANTNFNMVESDYESVVKSIIASGKSEGSTKLDIESWAYKLVPYEDNYIVAFAQNSAQRRIILTLSIVLVLAALASAGISFFISLFSANRSIKPIEQAYNKQKQFVADASHELRTPLASINANADVLLSKPDSTIESEKKWIVYIKDETERMTKLTNELLYLARSDSDEGDKLFSDVSFSDAVDEIVLENEAVAFEHNVVLNCDIEENINVSAALHSLKQLTLILVDNAIKYTAPGGVIDIKLKKDGGKAIFSVENTGEIAAEDLPHIFERFYRADKSRARESGGGYGLGLAIAQSIAANFDGSISAKSENGTTCFTVILPHS